MACVGGHLDEALSLSSVSWERVIFGFRGGGGDAVGFFASTPGFDLPCWVLGWDPLRTVFANVLFGGYCLAARLAVSSASWSTLVLPGLFW